MKRGIELECEVIDEEQFGATPTGTAETDAAGAGAVTAASGMRTLEPVSSDRGYRSLGSVDRRVLRYGAGPRLGGRPDGFPETNRPRESLVSPDARRVASVRHFLGSGGELPSIHLVE